jgi:hypothetical protein
MDFIKARVSRKNYTLIERDIGVYSEWGAYAFVFISLLSDKAVKAGYDYMSLLKNLAAIKGRYLVIIDDPKAPGIDFNRIIEFCDGAGYKIVKEYILSKDGNPYNAGKQFAGSSYRGILFIRKDIKQK